MSYPPIRNAQGELIATTYVPGADGRRDLVVIGHGVTSDKERPWSEALSAGLAVEGIASLRIAFSGNGESEGRFEEATITKEAGDLGAVLDAFPEARTSYIGQSMGGAVGVTFASEDPRLAALVTLASVTHTAAFCERMFGDLQPGQPMLDKPHCPWSANLRDDLHRLESIAPRAPRVGCPFLIVHGTEDDVVPVQDSHDLHAAAPGSELVVLEGVDHAFSDAGIPRLVEAVVPWLAARLAP